MRRILLSVALSLAAALPAAAQIGSPSDGFSYVGPFGPAASNGVPRFAQTFQRPGAGFDYLQSFTFFLGDYNPDATGTDLIFRAAVYEVNGSQLGTQLYLSDAQAGSANYFGFDTYTFLTNNLHLDAGVSTFALVLQSVSNQNDALNAIATGATDYADGVFFTVNDDDTFAAAIDGTSDAAFEASFSLSATPEPASLVLMGTGLLGVVGFARRRRSHSAA